jgi:CheY-like chemotaxis protein
MTTALIVDDSKLARIVVRRAIGELQPDWVVVEASGADDAMAIIARQTVDVAFIDYNMAGKNGIELCRDIRALHPAMPLALISANIQREIIDAARALNAAFVDKPITPEKLGAFIKSVV